MEYLSSCPVHYHSVLFVLFVCDALMGQRTWSNLNSVVGLVHVKSRLIKLMSSNLAEPHSSDESEVAANSVCLVLCDSIFHGANVLCFL